MLNHIRTLLFNSEEGITNHLNPAYNAVTLPNELSSFYNLIFFDQSKKTQLGNVYFNCLGAANLVDELNVLFNDSRMTLQPEQVITTDLQSFSEADTVDFVTIINKLNYGEADVARMVRVTSKFNTLKYDSLWFSHFHPVFKVGGLIAGYLLRMESIR